MPNNVCLFQLGVLKGRENLATLVTSLQSPLLLCIVSVARVQCKPNAQQLGLIRELVDTGKLKGHVATVLPLREVKQALELSAAGRTRGKIVLEIAAGSLYRHTLM